VWTPPKGVEVPPFPARRAALGGGLLVAVIVAAGIVVIPRIDESKQESRARESEALAQRRAAERRRLARDQVPVRGRASRPVEPVTPAGELMARRGLLRSVERAVATEARRRVRARTLSGRILRAECAPTAGSEGRGDRDVRVRRSAYDCVAITSDIPATATNVAGKIGYPFRAVIDFRRFTFTFCKTNPPPGERAVPDPSSTPGLPRGCAG
jgi:hypothetical protein